MRINFKSKLLLIAACIICLWSCTEPYNAINENYEELLVVEATITDSLQHHTVKLSKTRPVDSQTAIKESNAQVWIENNGGEVFQFSETEEGLYISDVEFAAETEKSYKLHVKTSNGKEYVSGDETTPQKIDLNIYAESGQNDLGAEGVNIFANVLATQNETVFVKYEYTEVYKIVTLVNIPYDYEVRNIVYDPDFDHNCTISFDPFVSERTENSSICYSFPTVSNRIIQNTSSSYGNNEIPNMKVHFIPKEAYKLRERYSILVRAYSQNYNSYQYYSNIKKINSNDSELSFQQPGYIKGNMISLADNNENVLGFFNVWSIAQKRIFMDYSDFGFPIPDYFADIDVINSGPGGNTPCPGPTGAQIFLDYYARSYQLVSTFPPIPPLAPGESVLFMGSYTLVNPECSDCRNYGQNYPPDYWEEE